MACVRYDHYPIHHRRASSVPSLFCAAFPVAQPDRASTTSPSRPAPASRALRPAWLLIQQVKWAFSRGLDPTGQPVLPTDDYMGGRFRHPVLCALRAHCEIRAGLPAAGTASCTYGFDERQPLAGSHFINGEAPIIK